MSKQKPIDLETINRIKLIASDIQAQTKGIVSGSRGAYAPAKNLANGGTRRPNDIVT